mmetsp:Transcript_38284/g.85893  ORF Transcript_38284/g.85893 Transcript_38284/m.85893 type:complete len:89 (-) Transcript_38284:160-426(-)
MAAGAAPRPGEVATAAGAAPELLGAAQLGFTGGAATAACEGLGPLWIAEMWHVLPSARFCHIFSFQLFAPTKVAWRVANRFRWLFFWI